MSSPAVVARGLVKRFGERAAVDGLSFEVPSGAVTGFVGPNGSGKTTTMRMLLGLVRASAGTAEVLGRSIDDPASYSRRVGSLIEGPAFYPYLSARHNLELLCTLGELDRAQVPALLDRVGLAGRAGDRFSTFSLGMKQRLGIAAALLSAPEVLLLDEPVNGLDPGGIREIRELLRSLADEGKAVLLSSHLLGEVEQICDRLVMIDHGRLVFEGTMTDLLARRRGVLMVATEAPAQLVEVATICADAGYACDHKNGALHVDAPASWAGELNRRAAAAGITLTELHYAAPSLEEAFLSLTEGGRS